MNGWFSRCAVAKDLTLAQHFTSCERTQHELSTSAVGSLRTFAATHNDDCNADFADFRCTCINVRFGEPSTNGRFGRSGFAGYR